MESMASLFLNSPFKQNIQSWDVSKITTNAKCLNVGNEDGCNPATFVTLACDVTHPCGTLSSIHTLSTSSIICLRYAYVSYSKMYIYNMLNCVCLYRFV